MEPAGEPLIEPQDFECFGRIAIILDGAEIDLELNRPHAIEPPPPDVLIEILLNMVRFALNDHFYGDPDDADLGPTPEQRVH
jgi:hypothetical protein